MRSIIARSVMNATPFISVPHFGHKSGSTSNFFCSSRLHAERRFASGDSRSAGVTGSGDVPVPGAPDGSPPSPVAAFAPTTPACFARTVES